MSTRVASAPSVSRQLKNEAFSIGEARQIVADLFVPNPLIYWVDLLVSLSVGFVCFRLVREFTFPQILVPFSVSCILYYRAGLFIHEIVHRQVGQGSRMRAFSFVWNLLCGIPFLIPSFVYYTHHDHHRGSRYGTKEDGEYVPLARRHPVHILCYLSQTFIIAPLAVIRFGLITPLSWFSGSIRRWSHQHASSMIMDPAYLRPQPSDRVLRVIRLQEFGCFLCVLSVGILVALGVIPVFVVVQAYCTGMVIIGLNAIRTLGAHRWTSDGKKMSLVDQMLDSLNYPDNAWLSCVWAPVGLRFHALHHVFPSIPYHNLAQAHRRLMNELPLDSPYRKTEATSLTGVLVHLWQQASRSLSARASFRSSTYRLLARTRSRETQ